MIISYNWLKDLVPDLVASPTEVAELLTMHSFETEEINQLTLPPDVTVVRITKITPHPNADRLRLATVTDGQQDITVICGAPNIKEGDVVSYSPPGTTLKDEDGHSFIVKTATIRGVDSPGLLNSLRELGQHHDHSGVWLLPPDTSIGSKLASHLPDDTILDADVTPNRAHDCLSHIGIAREVAALLKLKVSEPSLSTLPPVQKTVANWTVHITDKRLCARYLGAILDDLQISPAPLWLQARLLAAGGKPINNLVDITNYVMFEYGNPTHLFDRTTLPGQRIRIQPAQAGQHITTLDQITHQLEGADVLVMADDQPVALAGVMGGQTGEIDAATSQALLEVANFNAYNVQETARRLNIYTEASARFSKGIDPNIVELAARRAVDLLREFAEAKVVGVIDNYPQPIHQRTIAFSPESTSRVAGMNITGAQSSKILKSLRCQIDNTARPWKVTIPSDRLDLRAEHDLVEEIVRFIGLDTIPAAKLQPRQLRPVALPHQVYWREVVRDTLVSLSLSEMHNYSFEPAEFAKILGITDRHHITLANPIAPEFDTMRISLLPGLLANLMTNREYFHRHAGRKESALFEIGRVFIPGHSGRVAGVIEQEHLAAVVVGHTPTLEEIADELTRRLSIDKINLSNLISKQIWQRLKYRLPVSACEIDLTELIQHIEGRPAQPQTLSQIQKQPTTTISYTPIDQYPSVYRDLSVLVAPQIRVEQVQEIIERIGGTLIADVDLFDIYESTEDTKSLAFHIAYQARDRTLTNKEINELHHTIIRALKDELSAQLRE